MAKKLKSVSSPKTRVRRTKEERIADLEAKAAALRLRAEVSNSPVVKAVLSARSNIRRALKMLEEEPNNQFTGHEKVQESDVVKEMERTLALLDDVAPIFGGHKVGDAEEAA